MIRNLAVTSALLALLALRPGAALAQDVDGTAACVGKAGPLTATVRIQPLPMAIEFDLTLTNQGPAPVHLDPSTAVLRTAQSAAPPFTAAETKGAHRDYGAYIFASLFQAVLLPLAIASQISFNRYVDSRALQVAEIGPGQTARGSLFFPLPPEGQVRATLELGAGALGRALSLKVYCALPRSVAELNETPAFPPLTVSIDAQGQAGPITVRVATVEFAAAYTAVELSIANRSQAGAEIFMAMASASLRDGAGTIYPERFTRSEFVDRIPPTGSAVARLVFAPLPASTTAASLRLPGVWFGPENSVDVTVELKF